jgi:hypothetical protein
MLRHRLPAAALLGLGLLAAAPGAAAAPNSDHFDALVAEMNDRDLALPFTGLTKEQKKERRVVNRFFAALAADSADLAGDLRMARRMARNLEAGYPGDGVITGLLSDLDDALGDDIAAVRTEVESTLSLAEPGTLHDRAQAKIDAADLLLVEADEAGTQALRARLQERAHKALLAANRLALRAGPGDPGGGSVFTALVDGSGWQSNSDYGTAVSGSADVSTGNGGVRKITMSGRRILPSDGDPRFPGDSTRLVLSFLSNNENVIVGDYVIGTSNGVNVSATWYDEPEAGGFAQAVATTGSVSITSLTINLGSIDVQGTFDLSMYDAVADATFPIASGTFQVFGLPRQSVP